VPARTSAMVMLPGPPTSSAAFHSPDTAWPSSRRSAVVGCQILIRAVPARVPASTRPGSMWLANSTARPAGLTGGCTRTTSRSSPRLASRFRFKLPPRSRPRCRGIAHRAASTSHSCADATARVPRRPPPASSTPARYALPFNCPAEVMRRVVMDCKPRARGTGIQDPPHGRRVWFGLGRGARVPNWTVRAAQWRMRLLRPASEDDMAAAFLAGEAASPR
jgi:hypothetical protein